MNAVARAALDYLDRGWRVLPVLPDKTPALDLLEATRGTRRWHGLRAEPADAAEVNTWFGLDPHANVGVICGDGLVVVDVDDPDGDVPELPETATVATPNGSHHYFHADGPVRGSTEKWGEVRAAGLYVVAPASIDKSGRPYRWTNTLDLAELPEALRKRAAAKKPVGHDRATDSLGFNYLLSRADHRGGLEQLDAHEDVVRRLLETLGGPADVALGQAFHCLLHEDHRPSASLYRLDSGLIVYHCFAACGPGRTGWFPLAAVHARRQGRRAFRLGRVELALWKLDLLARAGLLQPVDLDAPAVPGDLEAVWTGFLNLVALRWLTTPGRPTPFARSFAAPWCGLSAHELRRGFEELRRLRLVRYAGCDARGLSLWLPCEEVRPIA